MPATRTRRRLAGLALIPALVVGAPSAAMPGAAMPGAAAPGAVAPADAAEASTRAGDATPHLSQMASPDAERPAWTMPLGISPGFGIIDLPEAQLRADLDAMRRVGARQVRVDLSWARVEGVRGRYDWEDTDRVFRAARAAGLSAVAVIGYVPDWAQLPSGAPDPRRFAGFAAAAARRYHDAIHAWEIWNEPNLIRFWSTRVDPIAYAALVAAAAPAIRRHDPRAKVVVGALAPAVDMSDGSALSPLTFLRQFYRHSRLEDFDAVSVHPYSYPALPTGGQEWNTFHRLPDLRAVMLAAGDRSSRLWLTEYGAPTGAADRSVTHERQARMVVQAYRQASRLRYVGSLFVYSIRDLAPRTSTDAEDAFGLMRHGGRPKPAFWALQRELRRVG